MGDIVEFLRSISGESGDQAGYPECQAAADEIERLRAERRWIPVGERLPENDCSVLVAWSYPEDKKQCVSQAWCGSLESFTNLDGVEFPGVTHWMPRPAPPDAAT